MSTRRNYRNERRKNRARSILQTMRNATNDPKATAQTALTDLLTDQLHLVGLEIFDNALRAARGHWEVETGGPSDDDYRAAARRLRHRDGETEIDDGAPVSRGDDPGAYVQAWVWVAEEDVHR